MPNTRSLLHVHAAPGPSTGMTLYRRGLGPCTGTPYAEQTDTHDWKHCLPATLLAGGNNDDNDSQQTWHAPIEPKNISITTRLMNFDRNDSAWNEKSPAQTSLFRSCWEILIKEQPVTYLYPVSMILIKTLWRSGGLPVLMESKVSSSFLYMIARNQLLHNVAILRESGFNFKLFYGQRWCRGCARRNFDGLKNILLQNSSVGFEEQLTIWLLVFSLVCQLHLNIFIPQEMESFIFTARKRSLRRLCFHRCLTVNRGVCPIACWDTDPPPLGTRGRHPPGRHPPRPEADTPWADIP